jgi:rod shape-determining protein MreC
MRIKAMGATGRLSMVRSMLHRFTFVLLVAAAVILMIVGRNDGVLIERTRSFVLDVLTPVFDALSRPASAVANSVEYFRQLGNIRADNQRLREENEHLAHWHTLATRLASENAVLHQQLNYVPEPDPAYISARVIGDVASGFGQSLLLGAGARDGVRKGQAVLSGEFLVGYVSQVADHISRLLLLTDINAHMPVHPHPSHFIRRQPGYAQAGLSLRQCQLPDWRSGGHIVERRSLSTRTDNRDHIGHIRWCLSGCPGGEPRSA